MSSDLGWPDADLELDVVGEVKIAIAMNERLAGVSFPDLNGKIDFSAGFRGSNPSFHHQCRNLFEFYWLQAKNIKLQ